MPDTTARYEALNQPGRPDRADAPVSNIPVPDPSVLTTLAMQREVAHLKELLHAEVNMLRAATAQSLVEKDLRDNQRFDAQSKALDAARIAADLAVQAALVAAEKAVSKAEIAAEKRFDTVSEKVDDVKTSTGDAIGAITAQLASIAGKGSGVSASWGYLLGGVGLISLIIGIVAVLSQTRNGG